MTLAEFAEAIGDTCGMTDSDSVLKIKRAVSRRYRMIWDQHLWREALALVTLAADGDELIMPAAIERVVAVRYDAQMLYPADQATIFQFDPTIFERSGQPMLFSHLTPIGCLPPDDDGIAVRSSSTEDTGEVLFRGEVAGVAVEETVTLNGTTDVLVATMFEVIYTAAKPITAGTVTFLSGLGSPPIYLLLGPNETEKKMPRIRLHEQPRDLTKSLLICGKRRFQPMTSDLDTPLLPGLDNAILAYGRADEWKRQRQYSKSEAEAREAAAMVRIAIDGENTQGAAIMRIIPDTGEGESFDLGTGGFSGKGYW